MVGAIAAMGIAAWLFLCAFVVAQANPPYGDSLVTVAGLDLQTVTIPELEAAMASGRITSRQLTQAYLNRIAFFDHGCVKVNAVRTLTADAVAQADAAD